MKPKHQAAYAAVDLLRSYGFEDVRIEPHRVDVVTYTAGGRKHEIWVPATPKHPEAYIAKKCAHLRQQIEGARA